MRKQAGKGRWPYWLLGLLPFALALLGWSAAWLWPVPLPRTRVVLFHGNEEGLRLPRGHRLRPFLEEQAGLLEQRTLRVQVGFHEFKPTLAQLGAEFAADSALDAIAGLGRSSNPLRSLRALFRSATGGNRVRWEPRVDVDQLRRYVGTLEAEVKRDPIPGTWGRDGQPIEGVPGESLNLDQTVHALLTALHGGEEQAQVASQVIDASQLPKVAFASLSPPQARASATQVLSSQETVYRAHNSRARNVELASEKIDGAVILPGERLSFNAQVGRRSAAAGFYPAPEVRNGRLVDPSKESCPTCVGGGVCQVAGTLHAAAFFAGLEVLEQAPHSRLPAVCYLPPGLDTAVAWPPFVKEVADTKDLIVRNPYPFPVVVQSSAHGGHLQISLLGSMRPYRVDCCYHVDRDLQGTGAGVTITRVRTVFRPDGRPTERKHIAYSDPETCMHNRGWKMRCDPCEM